VIHRRRKGAIVGFGFIAEHGHVPAYREHEDLEIIAVADVCEARRAHASRAFASDVRIYANHTDMLKRLGSELDFIDIATPPYAHAAIVRDALECNLHVLCEKPLATTASQARHLLALADKAQRVLFPVDNYRHAPVFCAVRELLNARVIGHVQELTISTYRASHARGAPEWNADWRRIKAYAGGGIGMDHGCHALYLAFDWLASYPTSVTATMLTRGAGDTEDMMVATLRFPNASATMHLTWNAGVRKSITTLHGDRGTIRIEDDNLQVAIRRNAPASSLVAETASDAQWDRMTRDVDSSWMDPRHSSWFSAMMREFTSAMSTPHWPQDKALDAVRYLEVLEAAYASALDRSREQRIVQVQ